MHKFNIVSTSTGCDEGGKKYILYKLCISRIVEDDTHSSHIDRRYTNFLDLYNNLKKEFPNLMAAVNFPNKVLIGNFNAEVIESRVKELESFMEHIAKESRLREAACTMSFFHKLELMEAKKLMANSKYDQAMIILEMIFTLLNKIYTDRSYIVLVALCRLVACGAGGKSDISEGATFAGPTERWANLALRRFDSVCDTDLLSLYVPLIRMCICIQKTLGKDVSLLENKLNDMKRRGIRVDVTQSLMDAIEKLEQSSDILISINRI